MTQPLIAVPKKFMNQAHINPAGEEAKILEMIAVQFKDEGYVILPSDWIEDSDLVEINLNDI